MSLLESIFSKKKAATKPISLVFGWGASGSTFLVQVIKRLEHGVHKEHMYKSVNKMNSYDLKMFTIRDPRDIITSTAKRHQTKLWDAGNHDEALSITIDHFLADSSMESYRTALADPTTQIIRYETFFNGNELLLIRWICDQLKINVSDERIKEIYADTSIEANKKRADQFKDFSEWDAESYIHGNHITNKGKPGAWRQAFSPEILAKAKKDLTPALVELGYEINSDWD